MDFEAHYSERNQIIRGLGGLGFGVIGFWMLMWPTIDIGGRTGLKITSLSDLLGVTPETIVRVVGFFGLFIAIVVLRRTIRNLLHKEAAIRINADGIYCHGLSEPHIPWSNVANIEFYSQHRTKMVHITLIDRQEPSFLRKLGQACGILISGGFRLMVQGTDGDYDDMVESLLSHTRAS
jgi:hypothetical protein